MDVNEDPITALDIACRMAQVVKTLVGRPMQVAIVKGLNRKLLSSQQCSMPKKPKILTLLQWHN